MIFMGVKFLAGARRERIILPGGNNDRDIDEKQTRQKSYSFRRKCSLK